MGWLLTQATGLLRRTGCLSRILLLGTRWYGVDPSLAAALVEREGIAVVGVARGGIVFGAVVVVLAVVAIALT